MKNISGFDVDTGLNAAIDQLAMITSVCWFGYVLRMEDGQVVWALDFEKVKGEKVSIDDMKKSMLVKKV